MTATDELRRLLDERGVEWRGGLPTETMVEADGLDLLYVTLPDGRVRAFIRNYLTPEQAVDATLGRGTCRDMGRYCFTCSECGWIANEPHHMLGGFYPSYCPSCGRKVVGE